MLHGFGGTRHAWDGVAAAIDGERYRSLAVDLPGHGTAAGVRPVTFDSCVAHVLALAPPRFALAGYSMGGRVALHVALAVPQRITRLGLVSTTAGIEDESERAARRASDEALARLLESEPYDAFIERWRGQALFADEPSFVAEAAREDQRRNGPAGLAASLRGVGTGEMAPLWERLAGLTMPAVVVVGERDVKFHALGQRLASSLGRAQLQVVPGGHAVALESPLEVAAALAP